MKKHTDLSLKGISALLINQDHSSLIYSLRMFDDRYLLEKSFREQYDKLINLMEL
jgi:chromosomal replication initiation ATPase DnaA